MPKWFNTNLLHNILNVAMAVIPVLEMVDYSPFTDAETALKITGALAAAKLIINGLRDGLTGLAKEQPPVK